MNPDPDDRPDANDRSSDDPDSDPDPDLAGADLTDAEVAALHEVELGVEWLHRAHGHLVQFHHATGHAMDHLAEAEAGLREAGYDGLADRLRDDLLPRGVVGDKWSYGVLEAFQAGPMADADSFGTDACEEVADGERHVAERRQEREWKGRSRT
ncbi:hypothetical protein M0R88_09600 [Halorussus gelatinilyticus]|uniref:Uncharacterized protein n=1 Tax=Halorussus gelatinilyticus TaxID=2937524 RepID=A0A8U0ICL4_9EURY|nr:hypothetical protein [Halorussus gelatinilyticus]UPV98786.1 hypothetical protein M0R88_09600 [Halorussus gelatinilyticus]